MSQITINALTLRLTNNGDVNLNGKNRNAVVVRLRPTRLMKWLIFIPTAIAFEVITKGLRKEKL